MQFSSTAAVACPRHLVIRRRSSGRQEAACNVPCSQHPLHRIRAHSFTRAPWPQRQQQHAMENGRHSHWVLHWHVASRPSYSGWTSSFAAPLYVIPFFTPEGGLGTGTIPAAYPCITPMIYGLIRFRIRMTGKRERAWGRS